MCETEREENEERGSVKRRATRIRERARVKVKIRMIKREQEGKER